MLRSVLAAMVAATMLAFPWAILVALVVLGAL